MTTTLTEMSDQELDSALVKFYLEARTSKGEQYSRSALLGFRNSIERHLNNNGRAIKIGKNPVFIKSNKMLDAKLRINRREGKENIKHKPAIESTDLVKIETSDFMDMNTPAGLLRKVWFYVTLYWCRRGREGQRELTRNSFAFRQDSDGRWYAVMTHDECTKNHQGGENSKPSSEKETRLYSTGESTDAFSCLKLYTEKLHPMCSAFFQRPKSNYQNVDEIWYENKPLGVNYLAKMMKCISSGCNLSQEYTNHSVRATAINLWSDADIPDRHITFVSGHSNEQSLAHYSRTPSAPQLQKFSDTISKALQPYNAVTSEPLSTIVPRNHQLLRNDPSSSAQTTTQNVLNVPSALPTTNPFSSGFFNACTIGSVHVFMGQQDRPTNN